MDGICLNFDENPIQDGISRIRFAPESNNLLISSWDKNLRLYDVDRSKLVLKLLGKLRFWIVVSREAAAFSANSDCSVIQYDLHSGVSNFFGKHDDLATSVEYSVETGQVITGGWDKKIKCWDSRSNMALTCENTVDVAIKSLSLSGYIAMVAVGTSVNLYDLRNFSKLYNSRDFNFQIKCVRPYLDRGFAVGSVEGRAALKYFNPSNQNSDGYTFLCHPKAKEKRHNVAAVNDIVFSPSIHGVFVTGDNDGYVTIWDAQSKKRVFEMLKFENSIASLSYSREGRFLAVASSYTFQEANELEIPKDIHTSNGFLFAQ